VAKRLVVLRNVSCIVAKIIPPGENFNTASPTIIREQLKKLEMEIQYDVREAIVLAAKNIERSSPQSESFGQAIVGASTLGAWAVKQIVFSTFTSPYFDCTYAKWKGIKGAKARKLLKRWSKY
jgi:hypothetical protein